MKTSERREPPASPYAPGGNGTGTSDPLRLATITMRAVDEIGEGAAANIEATAQAIESGAKEEATRMRQAGELLRAEIEKAAAAIETDGKGKAEKMRQLALAVRGQSRIESERVAGFCARVTTIFETISGLEAKLGGVEEAEPEGDPGDATPKFLHQPLN